MRIKTLLVLLVTFIFSIKILHAQQDLSGIYNVTGYFFHPTASRPIETQKNITQISADTYQLDYTGDLPGWGFRFTVDANNHLTNWVAVGATPAAPASGFMTADNPGGFSYSGPLYPGTAPWVQSTYNNTYDPATHTFFMHYGYNSSATSENGYDRQIYEKYVMLPSPEITSVTPLSGTSFTKVTIKGKNFSAVDAAAYSISFGNSTADSAAVVSDTKIIAWVGAGASGNISVTDTYFKTGTFPNFVYTPVPPVTNPHWSYVGKAGFSQNRVYNVNAASGSNNVPYVVFTDSASGKTKVMKYNGAKWIAVGSDVSDGKSSFTAIVLTKTDVPVVAYIDSANGGNITVKKFTGGNWVVVATAGFAHAGGAFQNPFSMAIDSTNIVYVLSANGGSLTVFKQNGKKWVTVGAEGFAVSGIGGANITIDKATNTPYMIFDDLNAPSPNYGYQASVMKFDGANWVTVGSPGFTTGRNGVFYPDIQIDRAGNPIASLQEDDGFERQSVYKYKGGSWKPVGLRFTKSRSYYNGLAIDKNSNLFALFEDGSYNKQGTVRKFQKDTGKWDTVGARGFLPLDGVLERNALVFDTASVPMIAFPDKTKGGKISVMKFDGASLAAITEQESRTNTPRENNTGISIFPNPAHAVITINFIAGNAKTILQVIDASGQTVIQKQTGFLKGKNNNVQLDISKLSAGTYILLLTSGNEIHTSQFVKE